MPGSALSPRQREILDRVARGESNVQIARALGISAKTVATHLRAAYIILHARNRVAAAVVWSHLQTPPCPACPRR